jgi:hypothetical protein
MHINYYALKILKTQSFKDQEDAPKIKIAEFKFIYLLLFIFFV